MHIKINGYICTYTCGYIHIYKYTCIYKHTHLHNQRTQATPCSWGYRTGYTGLVM